MATQKLPLSELRTATSTLTKLLNYDLVVMPAQIILRTSYH